MFRVTQFLNFVLIISLPLEKSKAEEGYLLSGITHFDRRYIEEFHMDIHPGNKTFDILCMTQNQPQALWFEILLDIKNRRTNKYRQIFQNGPVNYCELSKHSNFLNDFLMNIIGLGGVKIDQCPVKKAKYFWRNLSTANLPVPTSSFMVGLYRCQVLGSFYKGKQLIWNLTVLAEVK